MLQISRAKRMALGLSLLGSLALTSGCGEEPVSPTAATEADKAQMKSMADAMQKAHAPGGVASGKKPAPAK